MNSTLVWQIILQIVLIALNAVFASAEIAVISLNENKLEKLAESGNKKAVKLAGLVEQPARFLATIQVAITLSGFLGSAFAADNFSHSLTAILMKTGIGLPEKTLNTVSVVIITIILSYFTLVFGELVPKRVAMKNSEKLALGISTPIYGLSKLFAPLVTLLTFSTNSVLRLMGIDPESDDDAVTEEEIRMMVDAGSEKGAIDVEEKELIQNVFEFDDITIDEISTHRTEVVLLWIEETLDEWEKTIHESRHSVFPVCDESVDDVVGILNAKDFFRLRNCSREEIVKNAVKPAYFVPYNIKADVLFRNMKQSGNNFAMVLDEYGGVSGIVTMNDLIQQLVGDFDADNSAEEDEEIRRIDSGTWMIKGAAPLDEVEEKLGVKIDAEDCDTFGGFIFASLGSIPDDGSSFEIEAGGLNIKVTEIKEHRIVKSIVCIAEKKEEAAPEEH